VRTVVALIFGLDILLGPRLAASVTSGGFVAGIITRLALRGRELEVLESKLTAVGYGFLIPFFFVTSGMNFDLDALLDSGARMLEVPLFLALFLFVRGTPALLLYRGVLATRDRLALAVYSSTALPLVVAITTVAVDGDHMRSSTAAALVGAASLSTLIFPFMGLALRRQADEGDVDVAPAAVPT
jgi:Kef-type K+ transport system membrane component KefB